MLSLNTIKPTWGSRKKSKKLGRWNASGKGTFCWRGMNGQNSRSGWGVPQWFEGGQTPLFRRMPKLKGFSNSRFTQKYNILNLKDLNILIDKKLKTVDTSVFLENGMLRMKNAPVKILWVWELKWAITVKVEKASKSAIEAIEKAGGKVEISANHEGNQENEKKETKKPISEKIVKEEKAPTKKVTNWKADDLTKIEWIGPKIAETLVTAGIVTYTDLSTKKSEEISEIIADVRGSHTTDTWPQQAKMAAAWKWDELKKWQDEMDGGKPA